MRLPTGVVVPAKSGAGSGQQRMVGEDDEELDPLERAARDRMKKLTLSDAREDMNAALEQGNNLLDETQSTTTVDDVASTSALETPSERGGVPATLGGDDRESSASATEGGTTPSSG